MFSSSFKFHHSALPLLFFIFYLLLFIVHFTPKLGKFGMFSLVVNFVFSKGVGKKNYVISLWQLSYDD